MEYLTLEFITHDAFFKIGLALLVFTLILFRHLNKNNTLFVIKTIVLTVLLFMVLRVYLVRQIKDDKPAIAVLFDVSDSMKLTGRVNSVKTFYKKHKGLIEGSFNPVLFAFSKGSKKIESQNNIEKLNLGSETDIKKALWDARREIGGKLSGILLFSDGNHNSDTITENLVEELDVPVFTFISDRNEKLRDVSLRGIRVSGFVFKKTPVEISADIDAIGLKGESLMIKLTRLGKNKDVVSVKNVSVTDESASITVNLKYTPDSIGYEEFEVEIDGKKDEISYSNNKKKIKLKILREKLRVLYICGQPGPEYSFLRHALKNDPLVELVSFVILRNPDNIALVSEHDLSLIPFPVREIFTRDIYDYDVLILENFNYTRFSFVPEYLNNIYLWVMNKGGGLITIMGGSEFERSRWLNTKLADLLPVELGKYSKKTEEGGFKPEVLNYGHFITKIENSKDDNESLWKSMPILEGCEALSAKPDAEVLIKHPWSSYPVLTVWDFGKGRVSVLSTNTTWRLALGSESPEAYNSLWANIVRYTANAAESKDLNYNFDRQEYYSNQDFVLKIRINDEVKDKKLEAVFYSPSANKHIVPMVAQGSNGWIGKGKFDIPGMYNFKLILKENGIVLNDTGFKREVFASNLREESALNVDEQYLSTLASGSGGENFSQKTFSTLKIIDKISVDRSKQVIEKKSLHYRLIVFIVLVSLLFIEWFLRKLKGYY